MSHANVTRSERVLFQPLNIQMRPFSQIKKNGIFSTFSPTVCALDAASTSTAYKSNVRNSIRFSEPGNLCREGLSGDGLPQMLCADGLVLMII